MEEYEDPRTQLGLGASAPDYDTLKRDATTAYLGSGGSQADVDAYFAQHPVQDYGRLASDAAQWHTEQSPGDQSNQDVTNYLGLPAPPTGGSIGLAPPGPVTPNAGAFNYPQSWLDTYNTLDPATQQAISGRYSGMSPDAIKADWNTNVQPQFPGKDPGQILQGGAPQSPPAPTPYGGAYPQNWLDTYNKLDPTTQQAINARYSGMSPDQIMRDWETNIAPKFPGQSTDQILSGPSPTPNAAGLTGGPGSINRAMQSAQTAAPQFTPNALAQRRADEAAYGAGSGGKWDPWEQEIYTNRDGSLKPGYGYGATETNTYGGIPYTSPAPIIKWSDKGGPQYPAPPPPPPTPPYSPTNPDNPNKAFQTVKGQSFSGLQGLLDFMAKSTPASQAIKRAMEHRDFQGGSYEPGEKNLFDEFAKYLGSDVTKEPAGTTPFSDWNPVGLLQLLKKAGIITG